MAFQRAEGMSIIQALAMTVAEIPVFLYTTFGQNTFSQLRLSPGLRKVLFATALGTVALALAAHQLKRRKHKKKQITADGGNLRPGGVPPVMLPVRRSSSVKKGYSRRVQSPSSKSNDTLSGISSIEPSKHSSKHSSSTHSLASVVAVNSSNPNATSLASWEPREMAEQLANDSDAEHLYIQGVELFEEALHKWELALNIGQRCRSNTPTAQSSDVINDETSASILETSQTREFAGKLESLLSRAYNLQEEFGTSAPPDSMLLDLEGALMFPLLEGRRQLQMDDDISTTSDDSFFSAVEIFESINLNEGPFLPAKPAATYEDAMRLVSIGEVTCRTVRTQLLGCYNDQDFLAKLHCVRQAFKLLLQDEGNLQFFGEVGKQMVTGLIVKAEKNPKGFIENYEQMLLYASREETWPTTQRELEGRGVVCMNFFDIALDFILMDAFEDLENPPSSVIAVLRNRWLSDSFKETALATACWSVLKAKRRLLMVPDGFISHFYSVSEHVSPILAYGFLGPKENLTEICNFFKHQIVQYLKDMFDLDNVRYTTVQSLAEDILHLSHRRSDILLGYLGIDSTREINGDVHVGNGSGKEEELHL
ncbi:mitoguardin 2 isoform 1-T2 [Anomaloglossus baeobatrachus]|uniref:mitoguardin 2 n=1 Tax=Anomaloglossus baeobatrachus TaxID=238106 RepID=UPI003F505143